MYVTKKAAPDDELPADRAKREAYEAQEAAKQEAADKARIEAEQQQMINDAEEAQMREQTEAAKRNDEALQAALEAAPDIDSDDGDVEEPVVAEDDPFLVKQLSAKAAINKLNNIALDYQQNTPDSHVIFGRGGMLFTLGELRDIFNLQRAPS